MKWSTEHINRIARKVIDNGGEYRPVSRISSGTRNRSRKPGSRSARCWTSRTA